MTDFPSYPGGPGPDPYPGAAQPSPGAPPPFPGAAGSQPDPGGPQPYPGAGGPSPYPGDPTQGGGPALFGGGQVQRPPTPSSVLNAVKLMYVGAGLEVVGLAIAAASTGTIRSAVKKAYPHDSTATVNRLVHGEIAFLIIGAVIGVGLWVWMAQKNKAGRNWARVTGTVFFGISTLLQAVGLAQHTAVLSKLLGVVVWLVGLAIVILLWRRESSAYFKPKPQSSL
jgi:hypothetical protein